MMDKIYIDETSIVKTTKIGKGTRIWQFVIILEGAKIGENCNIGSHCFIESNVIIGNNVTIKNGVQIWNGIEIEDDVFIGPNVTFTNDLYPRSRNRDFILLKTKIKKGAAIGANSTILPGITIGSYSLIGAGSVVTKDVPDCAIVYGNPATLRGFICICGKKMLSIRKNKTENTENTIYVCEICKRKYRIEKIKINQIK